MPMALRKPHMPHVTLNTDGKRHPRENAATGATVVLGIIALVCALFEGAHILGSWIGLAGTITGLYAQYISATTAERFVNVIFLGMAVVGWALNMVNGGFV